jgi:tRNA 2-thiouridine synthesizing protein A
VVSTDPGALSDIPTWCRINQHEILNSEIIDNDVFITILVK